jgi:hypothetical protein
MGELATELTAAEDSAFAALSEVLREALAIGEGEPGEVGGGVAGGAFSKKEAPPS